MSGLRRSANQLRVKRPEDRAIFSARLSGGSATFRQQDMIFKGRLDRAVALMGTPRSQDSIMGRAHGTGAI
jgi:hypothetical protein